MLLRHRLLLPHRPRLLRLLLKLLRLLPPRLLIKPLPRLLHGLATKPLPRLPPRLLKLLPRLPLLRPLKKRSNLLFS